MLKRKLPIVERFAAALLFLFSAAATFASVNISNSSWESWAPRAASDSAGNFYVVWNEVYSESKGDYFFSKYTKSTQTWSTPQNLSNSGGAVSEGHDVGGIVVDASDNVHVVWTERTIVRLRSLSGGNWGPAETIGEGSQLEGAKIAAVGSGYLYIAWWGSDGVVRSRGRVNGAWESTQQISNRRSKFADIAAGQNSVMVTFAQKGSYYYNAAYVLRSVTMGSSWSYPATVSAEEKDQIYPDVEFLDGTTPEVIFIYENEAGIGSEVTHCAWTGNGFGPREVISSQATIHCPSLVAKSSVLVAIWQVGGWADGLSINYNYYYGGQWTTPTAISGSKGATYSDVALDSAGAVLSVWDGSGEIIASIDENGDTPTPNVEPVAIFSFLPTTGSAPLTVNFDASASYDPDGTIAEYDWIFGDGRTASGATVSHTFTQPGIYQNQLIVIDNLGKSGTKTQPLEIINLAPVPGFTINPPSGIIPVTIAFDADASSDPDGSIIQYDWAFSDGDTAQGKNIARVFTVPGNYLVRLTVTDNFYATASKTKTFVLLGLKPPLNVRWASFSDVSLFMSRIVTDVQWEANPENNDIAPITKYRIYRKAVADYGTAFHLVGETDGATFFWRDVNVETAGQYVYIVTAMDAEGHESPITEQSAVPGSRSTRIRRSVTGRSSLIRR